MIFLLTEWIRCPFGEFASLFDEFVSSLQIQFIVLLIRFAIDADWIPCFADEGRTCCVLVIE